MLSGTRIVHAALNANEPQYQHVYLFGYKSYTGISQSILISCKALIKAFAYSILSMRFDNHADQNSYYFSLICLFRVIMRRAFDSRFQIGKIMLSWPILI